VQHTSCWELSSPALVTRRPEFHVGGPETKSGLEIVGNYLTGIEMEPMPKGSAMGPDAVHLELDIHAAKDETHGFAEDAWVPYLRFLISRSPT
jgi:uncharacterized protein involved in high-affinity Fe2+ transport